MGSESWRFRPLSYTTHSERERLEIVLAGSTTDCSPVSMLPPGCECEAGSWCRWLDKGGAARARRVKASPKHSLSYLFARTERVAQHAQPCPGSMLIVSTLCPYIKMPLLSLQNLPQKLRSCCLTFFFNTVLGVNSSTGRRPS